ncbi:hypothetical protein [Sorangium sp. So ce341]|uniref:hypothetical protein n=1 Tax=Sorangium sp. So ce341 TaxID=3133302 RepID=UPI003F6356BF
MVIASESWRVGLNIVSGWDREEFEMFGVPSREHGERYEPAKEWLDVMRRRGGSGLRVLPSAQHAIGPVGATTRQARRLAQREPRRHRRALVEGLRARARLAGARD